MYRIGASSCGAPINEELMQDYAAHHVTEMEISEHYYTDYDYRAVKARADRFGVHLWSLHLPFWGEDLSATDAAARARTVQTHAEIIRRGAEIGVDKFVVHPSGEPITDEERPERMKRAQESLAALAEVGGECGAQICVEDLPRSCLSNSFANIQTLLRADARLKVCFDTNHITTEAPESLIRKLGSLIVTLHVSDFDFFNERHWLPGEGKVDWPAVLAALREVNYSGVWMYEVGFDCPKTIYRDRRLNCGDFYRNAHELFEGKQPTVFSRPKPNLGMWE